MAVAVFVKAKLIPLIWQSIKLALIDFRICGFYAGANPPLFDDRAQTLTSPPVE